MVSRRGVVHVLHGARQERALGLVSYGTERASFFVRFESRAFPDFSPHRPSSSVSWSSVLLPTSSRLVSRNSTTSFLFLLLPSSTDHFLLTAATTLSLTTHTSASRRRSLCTRPPSRSTPPQRPFKPSSTPSSTLFKTSSTYNPISTQPSGSVSAYGSSCSLLSSLSTPS
jgi:hypothetical protein